MQKMVALFKKYRETLLYLIFGALTTAVSWAVYYPLHYEAGFLAVSAKSVAWIVAVLFAFFTNKPFVFESHDWSVKTVVPEFLKFVGGRVGSGLFESFAMLVTVDILYWNGNIMYIVVSVFVVIMNYILSKVVFKKK